MVAGTIQGDVDSRTNMLNFTDHYDTWNVPVRCVIDSMGQLTIAGAALTGRFSATNQPGCQMARPGTFTGQMKLQKQ
jgi:hypothetical protein